MPERIKTHVWVSIAGGHTEPAGLVEEEGKRVVYTLGCPDPFFPDEEGSPCKILGPVIVPPDVPATSLESATEPPKKGRKGKPKQKGIPRGHSYRG